MDRLLWGAISLVILVPAMYFLPLGLTGRGRVTVVFTAIIMASFGQLTSMVIDLSRAILIISLLLLLIVYLLDKRMGNFLYIKKEDSIIKRGNTDYLKSSVQSNVISRQMKDNETPEPKLSSEDYNLNGENTPLLLSPETNNQPAELYDNNDDEISFLLMKKLEINNQAVESELLEIDYKDDIEAVFDHDFLNHNQESALQEAAAADAEDTVMEEIEEIDWEYIGVIEDSDIPSEQKDKNKPSEAI